MQDQGDPERRDLLALGSEISGGVVGAAAGLLLGGPAGSLAGAALGPTAAKSLRWAALEVAERITGRRGRARAMGAVLYAGQRLEELRATGAEVRDDGFFDKGPRGLSDADEIAEGVLLAAEGTFEERKVAHIGYLFANVATDDGIDSALAGLALRKAHELSWRQYQLLALVGAKDDLDVPDVQAGTDPGAWDAWGAHRELSDLYEGGFVHSGQEQTERVGLKYPSRSLLKVRFGTMGYLLHHLLSLELVPRSELDELCKVLAAQQTGGRSDDADAGP